MSGLFGADKIDKSAPVVSSLRVSTSNYGRAIPIGWGKFKVASWVLWYNDFKSIAYEDDTVSGGKGGSSPTRLKYRYEAAMIFGICEGPTNAPGALWKGKEYLTGVGTTTQTFTKVETVWPTEANAGVVVLDSPATVIAISVVAPNASWGEGPPDPINPALYTLVGNTLTFDSSLWSLYSFFVTYTYAQTLAPQSPFDQANLTFFSGTYAQTAWGYATSNHPTEALGYRGICYAASPAYNLGSDTSVPNTSFEIDSVFGYSLTIRDVNPKDFLTDFLTNSYYGANYTLRGLADWTDYSTYCIANGLFLSPDYTEQEAAAQIVERVMAITNSDLVYADQKLEIVPYADQAVTGNGKTWTPDLTAAYDLGIDDFLLNGDGGPIKVRRKSPNERYNQMRVKFRNRANQYNNDIHEVKDEAEIGKYGLRPTPYERESPEIKDKNVAVVSGSLLVQRAVNVCNTYSFKLPFRYALLKPMALLSLTYAPLELAGQLVRVTKISEQDSSADLDFEAEEVPVGTASSILYPTQAPAGSNVNVNVAPGSVEVPVIFEAPAQLTQNGLEVYIATTGLGTYWGGCTVHVSLDGTTYKAVDRRGSGSRYGNLTGPIASGVLPVLLKGGQLLSGTSAEAAALVTLCYIGGATKEFLAYETATLTGALAYNLGSLVRGAYGSSAASAHSTNDPFVRMDEALARSGLLDLSYVGKTIYVKLTSFNIYGQAEQSLADVTAYTYTITGSGLVLQPGVAGNGVDLQASSLTFQYPAAGGVNPSSITLTALLKGVVAGTVSWAVVSGTATLGISGATATLAAVDLTTDTALIRASVVTGGSTYTSEVTISKVREGATGAAGTSVYLATAFIQAASAPAAPTGGTFNFSTNTFVPPSGYTAAQPSSAANATYSTTFQFSTTTPGTTVTAGTWTTPVMIAAGVPTSGISVGSYFRHTAVTTPPSTAVAGIRFRTGGQVARKNSATSGSYTDYASWYYGASPPTTYYVRCQQASLTGGTLGGVGTAWNALSSDHTVTLTVVPNGSEIAVVNYQISSDSTGDTIVATGQIELEAETTP